MVNAGQTLLELEEYLTPDVVAQGCNPRTQEVKAGAGNIRNSRQPGHIAGSRAAGSMRLCIKVIIVTGARAMVPQAKFLLCKY